MNRNKDNSSDKQMALTQHWDRLSSREQLLISSLVIFTLGLLAYFYLVEPMKLKLVENSLEIEQKQQDVIWMKQQIPIIEQLKKQNSVFIKEDERPIGAFVDQTLLEAGLRSVTERILPEDERVSIWMSKAPLEKLIKWIHTISQYGVRVSKIDMTKHEDGLGNIELYLELEK